MAATIAVLAGCSASGSDTGGQVVAATADAAPSTSDSGSTVADSEGTVADSEGTVADSEGTGADSEGTGADSEGTGADSGGTGAGNAQANAANPQAFAEQNPNVPVAIPRGMTPTGLVAVRAYTEVHLGAMNDSSLMVCVVWVSTPRSDLSPRCGRDALAKHGDGVVFANKEKLNQAIVDASWDWIRPAVAGDGA